jgi:5,10-methylene-tetrahydrofolate dehydrogenase/methenyl tetrahydrofolate cyclohydrolase
LVGDRVDSATYVRLKKKACDEVGVLYDERLFPADVTFEVLEETLNEFNSRPDIHGILVQLPLPEHINENDLLSKIDYRKDVDGLLPPNVAALHMRGAEPLFVACTPKGCMDILRHHNVQVDGKCAVVIGRSNIVGVPMAALLQNANATVTVVHSRTPDIPFYTKNADIVVAAIGKPLFVKGEWLKPGCTVIDVGIN